jgi:hypothetical protein
LEDKNRILTITLEEKEFVFLKLRNEKDEYDGKMTQIIESLESNDINIKAVYDDKRKKELSTMSNDYEIKMCTLKSDNRNLVDRLCIQEKKYSEDMNSVHFKNKEEFENQLKISEIKAANSLRILHSNAKSEIEILKDKIVILNDSILNSDIILETSLKQKEIQISFDFNEKVEELNMLIKKERLVSERTREKTYQIQLEDMSNLQVENVKLKKENVMSLEKREHLELSIHNIKAECVSKFNKEIENMQNDVTDKNRQTMKLNLELDKVNSEFKRKMAFDQNIINNLRIDLQDCNKRFDSGIKNNNILDETNKQLQCNEKIFNAKIQNQERILKDAVEELKNEKEKVESCQTQNNILKETNEQVNHNQKIYKDEIYEKMVVLSNIIEELRAENIKIENKLCYCEETVTKKVNDTYKNLILDYENNYNNLGIKTTCLVEDLVKLTDEYTKREGKYTEMIESIKKINESETEQKIKKIRDDALVVIKQIKQKNMSLMMENSELKKEKLCIL